MTEETTEETKDLEFYAAEAKYWEARCHMAEKSMKALNLARIAAEQKMMLSTGSALAAEIEVALQKWRDQL